MAAIEIRYEGDDRLRAIVRGHELVMDQPVHDGGSDSGPTPTELFITALAACVGFYAERFCRRHELSASGLAVVCGFEMATDRPARVRAIELRVLLPEGFPADDRDRLLAVVRHCTVHNSITVAPDIAIELADPPRVEVATSEAAS